MVAYKIQNLLRLSEHYQSDALPLLQTYSTVNSRQYNFMSTGEKYSNGAGHKAAIKHTHTRVALATHEPKT